MAHAWKPASSARELMADGVAQAQSRDPGLSHAAIAKSVGLSPAFFSRVLSGDRKMGQEAAVRLTQRLGWDAEQRRRLLAYLSLESMRSDEARRLMLEDIERLEGDSAGGGSGETAAGFLERDVFQAIADWRHATLLEALLLDDLPDHQLPTLAKRLGLQTMEVDVALTRLLRLGLVERVDGRLRRTTTTINFGAYPSAALRNYHMQMIDRSRRAIDQGPHAEREYLTMTVAIDPERLPEAQQRLRGAVHELAGILHCGEKRRLYQLGIQLFRVDRDLEN